ncbi:hypothetical protein A9Q74_06355 [Colwellia sp. 39_35_sub15_T18]|nr:hypothetical protein A9Q74_06355 [Colwellia sp. 39_35_sub15_T18]
MKKTAQQGNWQFELKQVFCRKTAEHGQPYIASAVITITDGHAHVELLTNKDDDNFNRADFKDLKTFINGLGFEKVHYSRFKNNEKIEVIN